MSDGRPEAPLRGGDERRKDEDMRPTIRVTGVGRINRFTFVPSPHAFGLTVTAVHRDNFHNLTLYPASLPLILTSSPYHFAPQGPRFAG